MKKQTESKTESQIEKHAEQEANRVLELTLDQLSQVAGGFAKHGPVETGAKVSKN